MVDKIKKTGDELNKLSKQFDSIIEEAKDFSKVDYNSIFIFKVAKLNNEFSNKRIFECNKKCLLKGFLTDDNKNKNRLSNNQINFDFDCLESCYGSVIERTNMINDLISNINSDML